MKIIFIRIGPDIRFGRISNWIMKLSGRISCQVGYSALPYWNYPDGYPIFNLLNQATMTLSGRTSGEVEYPAQHHYINNIIITLPRRTIVFFYLVIHHETIDREIIFIILLIHLIPMKSNYSSLYFALTSILLLHCTVKNILLVAKLLYKR